jgi:hypothetical protein
MSTSEGWSRTPSLSVRRAFSSFEDLTIPAERTFGYYLITVPTAGRAQMIRASHPTASRIARSRTQYGEAELSFVEAIETPALD